MAIQQILEREGPGALDEARAEQPELLIDQFLPRYDLAIVHAEVLRAPPDACYRTARSVDLVARVNHPGTPGPSDSSAAAWKSSLRTPACSVGECANPHVPPG